MLKQNPDAEGFRGRIVNITSISAYTSSINRGDYCVVKAGLAMMTKVFADRLANDGINVYEIRPGVIATDMTGGVKEKYDKLILKDERGIHADPPLGQARGYRPRRPRDCGGSISVFDGRGVRCRRRLSPATGSEGSRAYGRAILSRATNVRASAGLGQSRTKACRCSSAATAPPGRRSSRLARL